MDAVKKSKGVCVVLAGAGTGKTHNIIEKIKYLIKNKVYEPERIVCIAFSNEAANNLLVRVRKNIDLKDKEPIIRTFHGFSADLLRKYGHRIGIDEEFKILTPEESKVVLHRNFKVTSFYCHKYIGSIGTAKDLGISLESFERFLQEKISETGISDFEKKLESLQFELQTVYLKKSMEEKRRILSEIGKINYLSNLKKFISAWSGYEKLKQKKNYLDYSDLNKNALELLKKSPEIANDYDYVIVDEFQDTNKVQLDLLFSLASHGNITVVGDLNQSIYRFRGAYKENMSVFRNHFGIELSDIFNLDMSYRSPNKVLRNAHGLILNNYLNKEECFMVENVNKIEGDEIEVYGMKNAKEEARKVAELVEKEIGSGKKMEDICVMFRTHQQGRIIKRALDIKGIQYSCVTKNSLLKNKSIKTVIDYLNILEKLKRKENGGDQAWWDLFYQLDFLEEDLTKIGGFIKMVKKNEEKECLSVRLFNSLCKIPLSGSGKLAAKALIERIKLLLPYVNKEVSELLKYIYGVIGLINKQSTRDEKEIMLNLNKFHELAKFHSSLYSPDLASFVHYLDILGSLGIEIESSELEKSGVRLMTLHATKGLEYKTVIITNMAQKRFPIERITGNSLIPPELSPEIKDKIENMSKGEILDYIRNYEIKNQILEERRLCYVAFTRAKEKLILTYAQEYGGKKYLPSQFLKEIKYEDNKDIKFAVDNDEKYKEPEVEIRPVVQDVKVSAEKKVFSPSALLLFDDCQKKYEYKYIYNMPDDKIVAWDAIRLGSFVHTVLENGVKNNFKSLKEFLDFAKEMNLKEDWESVSYDEAEHLIKVFFERNKHKYNEKSKTEQRLNAVLDGIKFTGFADRIDFSDSGLEIIDYKTGKSMVAPRNRNWQLGYYALAAQELGNVKKITLEMLKQEKPLEFEIDENGNAKALNSGRMEFNINDVRQELIDTAKKIIKAHSDGFKPCPVEKNCEFCNEYVYGL